ITIPKKTNKPTTTERFLSADFILFYKIIIVKGFNSGVISIKNFFETSLSFKTSIKQHYDTVAYAFCTSQIMSNDNRRCFKAILYLINQFVYFNTSNRI